MRAVLRVIAISALLTGLVPGVGRGAWLRPVPGPVVAPFSFSVADPYEAGRRRGIVLAAAPGERVRAACSGRVVFAGPVGRSGPTISVQCGALRATYQGIADVGVEAGQTVRRGEPIAAAAGPLHLGARAGQNRYLDPATLLAGSAPPLGPAPPGRARRPPPPVLPRAVPRPRPRASPSAPSPAPILAWVGLAALLVALGPLGLRLRRSSASSLRPACRTTSRRRSTT